MGIQVRKIVVNIGDQNKEERTCRSPNSKIVNEVLQWVNE